MNRTIRAFTRLIPALCALLALLAPLAAVASASDELTAVYKHISKPEFAKDLAAKKVKSVAVNERLHTLRVTLADGSHARVHYPKHQQQQTIARLERAGVEVKVLSSAEAKEEAKAKKPPHHKLRYIVGGVVIAVIVIVIATLLVVRRRRRE
jgi:ATP-dependent Zn protease